MWQVTNYREAYGLHVSSGILFNHESPLRPPRFVTRKIVSAACRIALGGAEKLTLGNIDIHRDWGWAPEYVEAMWRMLRQEEPGDYVVATGVTHSLREFVNTVFDTLSLDWCEHVVLSPALLRPTDIEYIRADPAKARRLLGWQARYRMADVARLMVQAELENVRTQSTRLTGTWEFLMLILAITYGAQPTTGGIERFCHAMFRHMLSEGVDLHTYSYTAHTSLPGETHIRRIKFVDRFFLYQRLRLALRGQRVDGIFCGHLFLAPLANRIACALNTELILPLYGIECWAGRLERYLPHLGRLRVACSISSFTTRQAIAQGLSGDKIAYLPPAVVDASAYRPAPAGPPVPGRPFFLLTVARLASSEQYKGHDKVIEALPLVLSQGVEVEYRIAGRGDDLPRLKALALNHGVADRVHFLGFVPDKELPALYAAADAFIMPSRVSLDPDNPQGEGFGIVFVEAALMEKPLIGPDEGGSTDIIEHGVNGLAVNPNDPVAIAAAIVRLAGDRDMCQRMGRAARASCLNDFTLDCLPRYLDPILGL